jgi:hypothetical protein
MAKLQDFGVPNNPGIMHPQLAHQFRVAFKMTPLGNEYSEAERKEVEAAIAALQSQVTELQLPRLKFVTAEGENLICTSDGHLHMVMEEDIMSRTLKAVFLLMKHRQSQRSDLQIDVLYLDGTENVLRVVSVRSANILAFVPGHLDYNPRIKTATGTITDPWREQPRDGYQYTNQISLSIPDGHRSASLQLHVSFDASSYITTFHV